MKSDLDALMQARRLDALVVLGNAENNPPMYYFTGGGHISNAALFKKVGQKPTIYCNAMERAEAAKSGLKSNSIAERCGGRVGENNPWKSSWNRASHRDAPVCMAHWMRAILWR